MQHTEEETESFLDDWTIVRRQRTFNWDPIGDERIQQPIRWWSRWSENNIGPGNTRLLKLTFKFLIFSQNIEYSNLIIWGKLVELLVVSNRSII